MATVNIGSLRFDWKGAYNGSTAYAVDDVVSYNGSSYICILASTGNLPTNTTYFQPMATKGTDGTDVGTTLTTQGDILYRDGSGLQRLAAGTANQVLQTGGAGANPSWGTVSSDFVKIATQSLDATGLASVEFQNCFSSANDALYGGYVLHAYMQNNGGQGGFQARYMSGTNTELSGSNDYVRAGMEGYIQTNNASNNTGGTNDGDGRNNMDFDNWGFNSDNNHLEGNYVVVNFQGSIYSSDTARNCIVQMSSRDYSSPSYVVGALKAYRYTGSTNITGLKFYCSSGALSKGQITLWGLKK